MSISLPISILIWDADRPIPKTDDTVILWSEFAGTKEHCISIPSLVEKKSSLFRSQFTTLIYDLGQTYIGKKKTKDYFRISTGFSLWWMSLLNEKANFAKSLYLADVIKLYAFFDWFESKTIDKIHLVSPNKNLSKSLANLCTTRDIPFAFTRLQSKPKSKHVFLRIFSRFPFELQAVVWLVKYLSSRWGLRGAGVSKWKQTLSNVTFVSYLFNLDKASTENGDYNSQYWSNLPNELNDINHKLNFIHIFIPNSVLPNARTAKCALNKFNNQSQDKQSHVALDSFLSLVVVYKTVKDWLGITIKTRMLHRKFLVIDNNGLDFSSLFSFDFYDSFCGKTAMSNCLHYNLLSEALRYLPTQQYCVYLQENMDWEFALIWIWKFLGHKTIIGYPHTTVRFWDLRYFFDLRCFQNVSSRTLPIPDKIAVNGNLAKQSLLEFGYPPEYLIDVEATRFGYLLFAPKNLLSPSSKLFCICILLNCMNNVNSRQISVLLDALQQLDYTFRIIVKPHPLLPVDESQFPFVKVEIKTNPVSELLPICNIVYTGAATSAAVDAVCYGVPVISLLDPAYLNLHPLRSEKFVTFVNSANELASAIWNSQNSTLRTEPPQNYFFLDPRFQRWKSLIVTSDGP